MSVDFSYLLRKEDPGATLRDLDDVVALAPVVTDDGDTIPAGTEGTIVGVWKGGEAFFVEFPEPAGALATVLPVNLRRTGRHTP
ncbi:MULTISPECIES: DUF4926 domain-containing protein [unclassified Methylobacterium]|uniref:DUF4926 domain-containing protein n=1 Tax=unclassified Methylobacterium TaxID=2615210 RepID=UPI001FBA1E6B|nr:MULTISPECIES: DUF4926 domain-containing protein [unclassified Methylobacterium]MCJ2092276.1 DUF4926 domain-containing protein [Methylobacterium sp. J-072]MCJ2140848.1 DUF4926 domain-containing protein [Methylobacterium sp. E-066]